MQEPLAPRTRAAYSSDWRAWAAWCRNHGVEPSPVRPDLVGRHLADLAVAVDAQGSPRFGPATLLRRTAALAWYTRTDETAPDLRKHPSVAPLLAQARRARDAAQRPTRPLPETALAAVIATMRHHTWPDGVAAARDTAALLLGSEARLGRAAAAALLVADAPRLLAATPSPTSPPTADPVRCLACALRRWLALQEADSRSASMRLLMHAGPPDDWAHICLGATSLPGYRQQHLPLLRPVSTAGFVSDAALSDGALNRILKRRLTAAEIDSATYTFCSLRAGRE